MCCPRKYAFSYGFQKNRRREQAIIRQRFGLNKGGEKTLEQVGVQFGITKERVRQIQQKTLKKMRSELEKKNVDSLASII